MFFAAFLPWSAPRLAPGTWDRPWSEADYVVLDTELTGFDVKKDAIVSIGAVRMRGKRILAGGSFYRTVNPGNRLTAASVVVHGITPSEVEDSPGMEETIRALAVFCGDSILAGHFLSLDLAFLGREMKKITGHGIANAAIDTRTINQWFREQKTWGGNDGVAGDQDLFSLAARQGIPVTDAHNALSDAFITAQLLQRYMARLPRYGVRTTGDLLTIGRP